MRENSQVLRIPVLVGLLALTQVASAPTSDLRIAISVPKTTFSAGEAIDWTVTLTNTSTAPLRVIKPDWRSARHPTPAPSAQFIVEREDGRVARQQQLCIGDGIGDTADRVSTVVAAGSQLTTTVDMFNCWGYSFTQETEDPLIAFKPEKQERFLGVGRYRISAKYDFPPGMYSRRWWAFLGSRAADPDHAEIPPLRVEEPWHGEITSNTVEITVTATQETDRQRAKSNGYNR